MATEIYGRSDDLIEVRGDQEGEVGFYGDGEAALVVCSDGTILEIYYGKGSLAVWGINLIRKGDLYDRIEPCHDEDADRYSDTAHFYEGLEWVHVATSWQKAR